MTKPDLELILKQQKAKLQQSEREMEIADVLHFISTTGDLKKKEMALSVLYKSAYAEGYQDCKLNKTEYWRN